MIKSEKSSVKCIPGHSVKTSWTSLCFFNSLWPSDDIHCNMVTKIWINIGLTAPNHYQHQCWLFIKYVLWLSTKSKTWFIIGSDHGLLHYTFTVETLYSTIYYSKYFIELHIGKSTQYVALWTHKRHPIPRPFGRAMECLLWVRQQKLIVL